MSKIFTFFTMIALTLVILAGSHNSANADAAKFLGNDHWKKGNAEWQWYKYDLKWYDTARKTNKSMMVLVTEPWNNELNVKGKADQYVLKFSMHDIFATGTYYYAFKADMFIDYRGRVIKYVMGSQDGCGAYFMRYDEMGDKGTFEFHSYWNDHGKIVKEIDPASFDTFYDALPAYLRFRLNEKEYKIKMVQPLIGNHPGGTTTKNKSEIDGMTYPTIVEATVKVEESGKGYKVTVTHGGKSDLFFFKKDFPHTLVFWKIAQGFTKKLRLSKFFAYWPPKVRGQKPMFNEKKGRRGSTKARRKK